MVVIYYASDVFSLCDKRTSKIRANYCNILHSTIHRMPVSMESMK